MENKFVKLEGLAVANAAENVHQEQEYGEGEDEEEEEALSFCDLPLDHLSRKRIEEEEEERIPLRGTEAQEDFHFCYLSKDSEMCDANEVFFQGQILPFHHSLSSDKGLFQYDRSISISESIGGSSSITLFSSRSSSISSSHRSYSGRSSASTNPLWLKLPNPPQSHFHSRRSSPPMTNFPIPGIIRPKNGICSKKTSSSVWNILRLGILVTSPPEIAFQDIKTRCPHIPNTNCKNFRSRNSTIRSSSSNNNIISDTQKRKPRRFLGGCNCSNDAVETAHSRVASIKKSASETEKQANVVQPAESPKQQAAKKQGTHYRTFEWLKQLSLEDTADET